MEQTKRVAPGKWVELAYDIYAVESRGNDEQITQTRVFQFTAEQPDGFVYGRDPAMLPKFSEVIGELSMGSEFDLPRDVFVRDGEFDSENVYEGAAVPMQFESGHVLEGRVLAVTADHVTLDFNHQLAGYGVRYRGRVLLVRDATAEELHPKHHHCGCGHCDHDHGADGCDGCGCGDA